MYVDEPEKREKASESQEMSSELEERDQESVISEDSILVQPANVRIAFWWSSLIIIIVAVVVSC